MSESEQGESAKAPEPKPEPEPKVAPEASEPEPATTESSSEASGADPVALDERPKKKKKKKRKADRDEPAEPRQELDADGRERPAFVLSFPSHPELDRVVRAFELGNYAYVRAEAPKLLEGTESPRVREAAGELLRRIEPDPLVKVLLAMSVLLLLVITFWAYRTHGN